MAVLDDEVDGWAIDLPGFGWSPPPADADYSVVSRRTAGVCAARKRPRRARPTRTPAGQLDGRCGQCRGCGDATRSGGHADADLTCTSRLATASRHHGCSPGGSTWARSARVQPTGARPRRATGRRNGRAQLRRRVRIHSEPPSRSRRRGASSHAVAVCGGSAFGRGARAASVIRRPWSSRAVVVGFAHCLPHVGHLRRTRPTCRCHGEACVRHSIFRTHRSSRCPASVT